MKRLAFVFISLFFAFSTAMAGTLNLQLDMKRWDVGEGIAATPQRNIIYFVIDCSGSMQETYTGPIKKYNNGIIKREDVLFALLEERWNSMPPNVEVYTYLYTIYKASKRPFFVCPIQGPVPEKDRKAKLTELTQHIKGLIAKGGLTPYFHTLSYVFDDIEQKGWLRASNVNLMVYDYTDGLNFTGPIKVRFPSPGRQENEQSAKQAEKEFLSLRGAFKDVLEAKGCYEPLWLGEQNTKGRSKGMKEIPEYTSSFKVDSKNLKNPNANATQDASAVLSFSMSEDNWKLLCGSRADIAVEIDGKTVATKQFTIKDGKESIALELPKLEDGKMVSLRVTCPDGKEGSFKLKSPSPVALGFPPMEKITLTSINVIPGNTVMKGDEVTFTAQTNGTDVTWEINGEKATGKTVTHKFNKVGKVSYSAMASSEGFKPSPKLSGSLTVIDIGIVVNPQYEPAMEGQEVTFSAKPTDGSMTPDKYVWTCEGPIENKDDADTMTLPGNSASIKHKFLKGGKYKIRATALYDALPTLTAKHEQTWTVDSRPTLKLSDRSEDKMVDGRLLSFGESFKLVAIPTGAIQKDDIVWYADGKEIQGVRGASIQAPPVKPSAGHGEIKVTYFARGKDKTGNVMETQKVSFSFKCGHIAPKIQSFDKAGTARKDFTRGEEMRFTLVPEDKYTDIVWEFGDGGSESTGNVGTVTHTFQQGGTTNDCKVTCKCRDCGVELTAESARVQIDSIELVNTFQIKAQKSSYSPKSTITLEATGKGYSKCTFWRKIGKDGEWKECEANNGTASIPDTLPDEITDVTYKLVMLDMDGKPNDESNQITVGVRRWWYAFIIFIGLFILWFIVKIGVSGNEPRGWTVYGKLSADRPDILKYASKWGYIEMSKCWCAWQFCKQEDKKGQVNISDVANNGKCPDEMATIRSTPNMPNFADISISQLWKRERLIQTTGTDGARVVYTYFKRNERNSKLNDLTLALAVEESRSCNAYMIFLIVLALALVGLAVFLCFLWAF